MDPELLALAQSLGIDLSALFGGGGGADPGDPPVFVGQRPRQNIGSAADFRNAESGGKRKFAEDVTRPLTQVNSDFYRLSDSALREFQQKAAAAGLLSNPRFGDYDDDSYKAWASVNERAARFGASGRNLTPSDVLDMATLNSVDTGKDKHGNTLSSPLDLEDTVQTAAYKRLGRRLTRKEAANFISVYQGIERRPKAQSDAARDQIAAGQDATVVAPPTAGSAAQQYIDSHLGQEAAGQDAFGYLDALAGLIGAA